MRVLQVEARNFSSYEIIVLNLESKELTLVSGVTGAGKSTLCDIIPWVLFGRTSKNGSVNDIISWGAQEDTSASVLLEISGQQYWITRTRGVRNDLCYCKTSPIIHPIMYGDVRGKDLNDTQKLINNLLGFDGDLYLSGAYFHEFSQAASFFTSTAKIRRQIVEQIVDLSIPKTIAENGSSYKKEAAACLHGVLASLEVHKRDLAQFKSNLNRNFEKGKNWNVGHLAQIESILTKSNRFEQDKTETLEKLWTAYYLEKFQLEAEITNLQNILKPQSYFDSAHDKLAKRTEEVEATANCAECGSPKNHQQKLLLTKDTYALKNLEALNEQNKILLTRKEQDLKKHFSEQSGALRRINEETDKDNPYKDQLIQLNTEVNPHTSAIVELEEDIAKLDNALMALEKDKTEYELEANDIEALLEINNNFRGILIKSTIKYLEESTNNLLTKHFDSEFRVSFEVADADKLDVSIVKDGNRCVYSQLSKGQRQLLKLVFGVSVMKQVSNRHGVNFNCIFLDEPTDGCDEALKVKAYGLLQELATEHESVFVIEHSEALKAMFSKKFSVSLVNGKSQIEES